MKTVLTLYKQNFSSDMLQRSEDLYSFLGKNGITLCRGLISDFNEKTGVFKKAIFFENKRWVWKKNVKPDLIYDRSILNVPPKQYQKRIILEKTYPFFNNLKIKNLLTNKWLTYLKFKKYCPKTILVEKRADLKKISSLSSKTIIVKPLFGAKGIGIKVLAKKDFTPIKYPFIVQEFIDSSSGIKGLVNGIHDLRIMVKNNKPFHFFLRIPSKNSLVANLSQGGKIKLLNEKDIPSNVMLMAKEIINVIKPLSTKNLYSIDLLLDKNGTPWIIELNAQPGIVLEKEELKNKQFYYKNIIDLFLN